MFDAFINMLGLLLKAGGVALVFNEIRGFVLAAPVIYAIYEAGGTLTAIWIGVCSLAGIALSVIVPLMVGGRLMRLLERWKHSRV